MVYRISEGTSQQPNQSADTLDPPFDMQLTIHEGVYQNLQSKLDANIFSTSLVNVPVAQGNISPSIDNSDSDPHVKD